MQQLKENTFEMALAVNKMVIDMTTEYSKVINELKACQTLIASQEDTIRGLKEELAGVELDKMGVK